LPKNITSHDKRGRNGLFRADIGTQRKKASIVVWAAEPLYLPPTQNLTRVVAGQVISRHSTPPWFAKNKTCLTAWCEPRFCAMCVTLTWATSSPTALLLPACDTASIPCRLTSNPPNEEISL